MARPGRFELPTLCLEGRRSIQLSYGRVDYCNYITELEASVHLPFGRDSCCAQFCAHPVLTSHLRPHLRTDTALRLTRQVELLPDCPSRVDAKRLFYGDSGEAKRLFRRKPNGIPG